MNCRAQRWAQIVLAALVVSMLCVAVARGERTYFCGSVVDDASSSEGCSVVVVADTAVVSGVVATCRGVESGADSCVLVGGEFGWRDVESLTSADMVADEAGGSVWVPWGGWTFRSAPSGGAGDDVDLESFARAWAAGFTLLAACWALGKVISMLLGLVRVE